MTTQEKQEFINEMIADITNQKFMQTIEGKISTYSEDTREVINDLIESSFAVEDMIDFITAFDEETFRKYYADYVGIGEEYGYNCVDEFIQEFSIEDLDHFSDAYKGEYLSFKKFAIEMFDDIHLHEIPENLHYYIDYDKWAQDLSYDYLMTDSGHIFSRDF